MCSVGQSYLTLCNPMDCSPPGSSVHGISQAKVLECVAISFFRKPSTPRNQTCVPCVGRQILYHWATKEAQLYLWTSVNCWIRYLIQLYLFRVTEKSDLHQAHWNNLGDGIKGHQAMEWSQAWERQSINCSPPQWVTNFLNILVNCLKKEIYFS